MTLRLSEAGLRLVDSAEAKPVCDYPLKQVPGWRLAKGEFTFQVVDDGRKEIFVLLTGNQAGAKIVDSADDVWGDAELILKVKEPIKDEYHRMREGQVLFTYLHLAASRDLTEGLLKSGATCIAYETVTSPHGGLPLLAPMSKVAGRMAIQAGAYCLEHPHGGLGMLLGGVPGVDPAKVVVLGAGVVGTHATHIAVGMGADVWVIDRSPEVIEAHWQQFGRSTNTVFSTRDALERHVLGQHALHSVLGAQFSSASSVDAPRWGRHMTWG